MTRTRTTTAALACALLGATLSVTATPSAGAAATTCQGRPVTVVGTGTEGDDVLLVEAVPDAGPTAYDGKGGDDLVCIRSRLQDEIYTITVSAGAGDDTVVNEVSDDDVWVTTVLGAGSDTYVGLDRAIPDDPKASPFHETVFAGEHDLTHAGLGETLDTEPDTIDTGAGEDVVHSGSTAPGATNGDVVRLGPGADRLSWGGEQTGVLDTGAGGDHLEVHPGWQGTDVAVDAAAGVATVDGRSVLRWTGEVATYTLMLDNPVVSFVGSDADESLYLSAAAATPPAASTGRRSVSMGAGDDHLRLGVRGSGSVDGGPGRDTYSSTGCGRAHVTFGGSFVCTPSDEQSTYAFAFDRWEDLFVGGGAVTVVGSPRAEKVKVVATRIRVRGLGGDDVLNANAVQGPGRPVVLSGGRGDDRVVGSYARDRLLGGRGDDKLFGDSRGDDILGGPGRDRAFGQHGRDRCVAEERRSCERR
ncbi:hypothetical protein [Nocardioides xinjiangensis]|uniref:hypothetical protein n=1 Tax=Nocardioides xinjiangensis TaxID=2817376 RepID=UPI001B30A95A|nr:hypothetical protein [Nocardioides sp. SYSU D00514]